MARSLVPATPFIVDTNSYIRYVVKATSKQIPVRDATEAKFSIAPS